MKDSIKKAFPACFGSSFAATLVQFFWRFGTMGISDFLFTFVIVLIITTMIVSLCFWIYGHITKKGRSN